MIMTVIIAIPNASDDVTIPTAIPTPSPNATGKQHNNIWFTGYIYTICRTNQVMFIKNKHFVEGIVVPKNHRDKVQHSGKGTG